MDHSRNQAVISRKYVGLDF